MNVRESYLPSFPFYEALRCHMFLALNIIIMKVTEQVCDKHSQKTPGQKVKASWPLSPFPSLEKKTVSGFLYTVTDLFYAY